MTGSELEDEALFLDFLALGLEKGMRGGEGRGERGVGRQRVRVGRQGSGLVFRGDLKVNRDLKV